MGNARNARARRYAPVRHQDLPRGTENVARTKVVSWLRTATLNLPGFLCQWLSTSARYVRYSGGAAPASNRFPWLPSAINCESKLLAAERVRKNGHHYAAERKNQRDEIT